MDSGMNRMVRQFEPESRRWARVSFRALALGVCLFSLISCGGSSFNGTEYTSDELAFRIGPSPDGARLVQSNDALITLRNDQAGTSMAINGRCRLDGDDVPLRALATHLFLQFDERTQVTEKEFRLDGRSALEVELDASLDGVQQHFIVVVMKKDACVYDFIHVDSGGSDPGIVQSREQFRAMVQGFQTTH